MSSIEIIDQALLRQVAEAGAAAPRRRRNHNFHRGNDDACHRLLNAMEPDSYVPPHCHLDPAKDETIVALKGRFGFVLFGEGGTVVQTAILEPGGETLGVNIPHGAFHSLVALEPGSVFLEAKSGPYRALTAEEKAAWAPEENTPEAIGYLHKIKELFETK